ncbi:MAG: hypothetical protein HC774_07735 [Sphingomonadales bacterium]|nr:hypothetical protein [Sphingomonadales bacterium]
MNPDMLEVGSGSFLADACIVGGQRLHGGTFELLPNRVGARTFIGNSALVPAGVDIGDDCLIGVLSRPPADVDRVPDGTRWLGSPGFRLPRTQQGASFTNAETFEPDPSLKRRRAVIDALRIVLPGLMQMSGLIAFLALVAAIAKSYGLWIAIALVPAAATAAGARHPARRSAGQDDGDRYVLPGHQTALVPLRMAQRARQRRL